LVTELGIILKKPLIILVRGAIKTTKKGRMVTMDGSKVTSPLTAEMTSRAKHPLPSLFGCPFFLNVLKGGTFGCRNKSS
jgi:hypothetical protein